MREAEMEKELTHPFAKGSSKSEGPDEKLRWLRMYSQKHYAKVFEEIDRIMGDEESTLYRAGKHLINAGGKLFRPSFVLFGCEAVGGDSEKALPIAAAAELAHVASLIHDDIIDGDDLRRGVPAVHVKFGVPLAILAGNLLIFKAFNSLAMAADTLGNDKVVRLLNVYSRTSIVMDQGEHLDIVPSDTNSTMEEYLDMAAKKTGWAFKGALEAGAIAGGGTEEEIEALSEYGLFFGVAFQIRDDVIGVLGNPSEIGKPTSDILRSRKTFMVTHVLQEADEGDKVTLLKILSGETSGKTQGIVDILTKYDSFGHAEAKIAELIEKTKLKLSILKNTLAKKFLLELADLLSERPLTILEALHYP